MSFWKLKYAIIFTVQSNLTRLNLSVFSDMLFHPMHGTTVPTFNLQTRCFLQGIESFSPFFYSSLWEWISLCLYSNIPPNQWQIFRTPSMFYFRIIIWIYGIHCVFLLYSHYGDSNSTDIRLLNVWTSWGHSFLFSNNTFHDHNNN